MAADPQFTLTPTAVTAIETLSGGGTMYFQARTYGVIASTLDDALAGGTFILRVQQRLKNLTRVVGVADTDAFADA